MVKEQLTKERIIADIKRSQMDHTPTAVTMTDNCIVWGSAAVACLIFVLTRSAYAFLLLLIPLVRFVTKALLKNEKRKALSANDFSVYTDTMQAVRETVVDVGGCGGRRFRNKTVLQFDSGEWEVPHRNYTCSDTFEMSREGIANTSLQGDTFYVVRLNSTGKIAVAYNEKFFDYKKEQADIEEIMKKKTIVALAFCVLILATIILTAVFAAETYRAEKNSPTINILEGLGAVVVAIFGSIIVFYGCDLFYTVYYLLFGLKRKAKTVLVILANLTWLLSFAYFYLANNVYMELRKYVFTPLVLFAVYIVLKIAALFFRPKDPNDASL